MRNTDELFQKIKEAKPGIVVSNIGGRAERNEVDHDLMWRLYTETGIGRFVIDWMLNLGLEAGLRTEGAEKPKQLVDELFEDLALDQTLRRIWLSMLLYGNCYTVKIWGTVKDREGQRIVRLQILSPATVLVKRSDDNDPTKTVYIQEVQGKKTGEWKAHEIIHWNWLNDGVRPYGVPFLGAILEDLDKLNELKNRELEILLWYAKPLWQVKVGAFPMGYTPMDYVPPTKSQITDFRGEWQQMEPNYDFIGPPDIEIEPKNINARGVIQPEVFRAMQEALVDGMQVPPLSYLKQSSEASAREMTGIAMRHVRALQRYSKRVAEHELIRPFLEKQGIEILNRENQVRVEFQSLDKMKDAERVDFLRTLLDPSRVMVTEETRKEVENQLRKEFLGVEVLKPEEMIFQPPLTPGIQGLVGAKPAQPQPEEKPSEREKVDVVKEILDKLSEEP